MSASEEPSHERERRYAMSASEEPSHERERRYAMSASEEPSHERQEWAARATSYALWPELVSGETRHRVLERLEPVADERLLDLGSGPGAMARAAGPFVAGVVLCDLAPAMLRVAG